MIQRIQTLYLLAATILLAAMFFFPSAAFYAEGSEADVSTLNAIGVTSISGELIQIKWGVLVFSVLSALSSFVAIFLFKNRKRQIRIANVAALSILLQVVSVLVYSRVYASSEHVSMYYFLYIAFPFLAYVLVWLARKNIRKDEELVRAADRIR